MQHNADLESENAELRAELAAAHANVVVHEEAAPNQALPTEQPCGAEGAGWVDNGLRLLQLASHSALIAAAYKVRCTLPSLRGLPCTGLPT